MNRELPNVKVEFIKSRGTRGQIANINWIIEKKQKNSRKTSNSVSLIRLKPMTEWNTTVENS